MAGVSPANGSLVVVAGIADAATSVKIGVDNQEEKKEQHEQRSGDCQQEEKNDGNGVLPGRAQPNAAYYHSCKRGQDRQPRQNVE